NHYRFSKDHSLDERPTRPLRRNTSGADCRVDAGTGLSGFLDARFSFLRSPLVFFTSQSGELRTSANSRTGKLMSKELAPSTVFDEAASARIRVVQSLPRGARVHLSGICGTGMAAVASLLKQLGF